MAKSRRFISYLLSTNGLNEGQKNSTGPRKLLADPIKIEKSGADYNYLIFRQSAN